MSVISGFGPRVISQLCGGLGRYDAKRGRERLLCIF